MDCDICNNKFNKSTRKQVQCPGCQATACRTCYSTFICERASDACCMFCKMIWSDDTLFELFTKKFVKETMVKHIVENIFATEVATQLGSQVVLNGVRECREVGVHPDIYMFNIKAPSEAKHVRMFRCPGCSGFVNSETMKCLKCSNNVCSKCHCIALVSHSCNPQDVETVRMLKKDTKPCPTCAAPIFKIDGCDQMWCVECKTAFSWRTLKIDTGHVHNPHYNEYMRNNGGLPRHPLDVPGGEVIDLDQMPQHFTYTRLEYATHKFMENVHRNIRQMRHIGIIHGNLTYYKVEREKIERKDIARRVKYVLGMITDEQYKKELASRYNLIRKLNAYSNFAETYATCLEEMFNIFDIIYWSNGSAEMFSKLVDDIKELDSLMFSKLVELSKLYGSSHNPSIRLKELRTSFFWIGV